MITLSKSDGAKRSSPGWLPGLDGLRAIAVAAVVVFHFAGSALPGGFLGVDLFFAISGFLITRLLLIQIDRTGRLDLIGFYRRRWRRLFPAVLALLVVVTIAALTVWRDEIPTLREGVIASAGFVTNWWLIADHQSYFVSIGRPTMVQHLWSLAIEEQFYLVWPLVLALIVGALAWLRPRGRGAEVTRAGLVRVAAASAVLGVGSALLMASIAIRDDVPYGTDSARVYFGTDTHASGLLFGAAFGALSLWWSVGDPSRRRPGRDWSPGVARFGRRVRWCAIDGTALAALGLLGWQVYRISEFDPALYRGGFAVISLLAAIAVAAVASRHSRLARLLDVGILRWLGQRSYGIYLWHWPVAVVTRPNIDVTGPRWLLIGNQIAITVLLAAASYRFVEQPFRTGAVARWLDGYRRPPRSARPARPKSSSPRRLAALVLTAASVAAVVAAVQLPQHPAVAESTHRPGPSPLPTHTAIDTFRTPPAGAAASTAPTSGAPAPGSSPAPPATVPEPATTPPVPAPAPAPVGPAHPELASLPVSAFGDSVMLGAAPALQAAFPGIQISAIEGRQARAVFADVGARRAAGQLGQIVVIHAGDNGIIAPDDLRQTLASVADRRLVVLMTVRVPREWQGPNNDTLKRIAPQFPNARVLDWYSISDAQTGWFWSDGLHLRPDGAAVYAAQVRATIQAG